MKYTAIEKAIFISRPNRFVAHVSINGRDEIVHVKNTGRCRELLPKGAEVFLERSSNENRKTAYDLVAVNKAGKLINMDSQAPNKVFLEWLNEGNFIQNPDFIKPEYQWGKSRFDFYIEKGERRCLIEVKGVTLEFDGECYFPDAPTERGVKHLLELAAARDAGYECYIVFIIQMAEVKFLSPNDKTHPDFGEALRYARDRGVEIIALDSIVTPDSLRIRGNIPVIL